MRKLYPPEDNKKSNEDLVKNIYILGFFYEFLDRFSDAEKLYIQALEINRKLYPPEEYPNGHENLATNLELLASQYKSLRHYSMAEKLYLEALEMRQKLYPPEEYPNGHTDLARSLNSLAGLFESQGRYPEAEKLYLEALEMRRKLFPSEEYPNGHTDLARSLNNLAVLYKSQGRYPEAEKLFVEALEMTRKLFPSEEYPNGHTDLAGSINNLAVLYESHGRYPEAEKLNLEALEMYRKLFPTEEYPNGHTDLAGCLNNLAGLYKSQGRYPEAEKLYLEALEMYRKLFPSEEYPNGHIDLATSLNNLAGLYESQGRYPEAEKLLLENNAILKQIFITNSLTMSEKEKEQFWGLHEYKFKSFYSFVLKRIKGNPSITEQALNNTLFTKAMLLNSTKKVKQRIINSGDKQLIEKYNSWIALREKLAKLYNLSYYELQQQKINRDSIEKIANSLEKELSEKSESFANSYSKQQYTFQDIKSELKENETAVEIVRFNYYDNRWTDTVYYMALIVSEDTKDHPKMVLIENGNEIENELFERYKTDVASSKGLYSDYKKTLKEIYTKIWKPIKDALPPSTETIYLSLDGIYNKINLNSLINPETGNYLLTENDIRIVTSTRDIAENKNEQITNTRGRTAALFGFPKYDLDSARYNEIATNYQRDMEEYVYGSTLDSIRAGQWDQLPGTKIEVEIVDSLLKTQNWLTKKYIGEEALEEAVKSLNSPRILHIATHGFFLSTEEIERRYEENRLAAKMFGVETHIAYKDPLLRSGLLLAGAKSGMENDRLLSTHRDNGILTAKEVMNLDLDNTELVVLSACETGLGDIRNGEGVYGLQRAFRVAGAKSLINSLWKVPDKETQELMMKFYSYWLIDGKSKTEAFKQAQIEMSSLHPFFWAAFVLVGE